MDYLARAEETRQGAGAGGSLPLARAGDGAAALSTGSLQDFDLAALIEGTRWDFARGADGRMTITYSFAGAGSVYPQQDFAASAQSLSGADRDAVRAVLARIEAVAAIRFVEVADDGAQHGTLRYAYSAQPNALGFAGFTFFPSGHDEAGEVWLGRDQAGTQWDFYRASLMLHETLHALGLKHPFEGPQPLAAAQDIIANTVMSYSPLAGYGQGVLSDYPDQPMGADVAALQALYGAAVHNAGNTTYRLDEPQWRDGFQALWDSGGSDLFDASRLTAGVQLDLAPGGRSDIGAQVLASAVGPNGSTVSGSYRQTLTIAPGAVIEHAVGTAFADVLQGNAAANYLAGGAGDDRLAGLGGDDWLDGGAGSDWLAGGEGSDTAVYRGPLAAYDVWLDGAQVKVRDRASGELDTLVNMERAAFADVTLSRTGISQPVALAGVSDLAY